MASSKVCVAAALCSFIIFTIFTSNTKTASCCMRYSKHRPSLRNILGYNTQPITGSCDISAIIFFYKDNNQRNRFLCAKPSAPWTKMAMNHIEEKRNLIKS